MSKFFVLFTFLSTHLLFAEHFGPLARVQAVLKKYPSFQLKSTFPLATGLWGVVYRISDGVSESVLKVMNNDHPRAYAEEMIKLDFRIAQKCREYGLPYPETELWQNGSDFAIRKGFVDGPSLFTALKKNDQDLIGQALEQIYEKLINDRIYICDLNPYNLIYGTALKKWMIIDANEVVRCGTSREAAARFAENLTYPADPYNCEWSYENMLFRKYILEPIRKKYIHPEILLKSQLPFIDRYWEDDASAFVSRLQSFPSLTPFFYKYECLAKFRREIKDSQQYGYKYRNIKQGRIIFGNKGEIWLQRANSFPVCINREPVIHFAILEDDGELTKFYGIFATGMHWFGSLRLDKDKIEYTNLEEVPLIAKNLQVVSQDGLFYVYILDCENNLYLRKYNSDFSPTENWEKVGGNIEAVYPLFYKGKDYRGRIICKVNGNLSILSLDDNAISAKPERGSGIVSQPILIERESGEYDLYVARNDGQIYHYIADPDFDFSKPKEKFWAIMDQIDPSKEGSESYYGTFGADSFPLQRKRELFTQYGLKITDTLYIFPNLILPESI